MIGLPGTKGDGYKSLRHWPIGLDNAHGLPTFPAKGDIIFQRRVKNSTLVGSSLALLVVLIAIGLGMPVPLAQAQAPTPTPDPFTFPSSTTFTVNFANDANDGMCDATHCSLREAIDAANANAGGDTIQFNILGTGPHTIQPTSALPTITDPVIIDGYTQPGASPNTNGPGLGLNTVLKIELDGTNAGSGADGLTITTGNNTVRGLVINRFGGAGTQFGSAGIQIGGSGGNIVEGNFIGVDVTGTSALGNSGSGVRITSPNNTVGGTTAAAGNVISGNGFTLMEFSSLAVSRRGTRCRAISWGPILPAQPPWVTLSKAYVL